MRLAQPLLLLSACQATKARLTLPATDHDRRYVPAEWTAPDERDRHLRDSVTGRILPCQREGRVLRWLIRDLPAVAEAS